MLKLMGLRRKPAWKAWEEEQERMPLTPVRRKILENIRDGRYVYDGFEGSQLGGAVRSLQMMRGLRRYVVGGPEVENLKLTEAGAQALEREN